MPPAAQPSYPPPRSDVAAARKARLARRHAALDAEKRAFLRMVSHELRTPLNAIIGFSEIMAAELYGPLGSQQYKDYAEHVRTSGHRLLRLVNQVLEIARLEGHAVDVDPTAEGLDYAIEDTLTALRDEIAAAGAKVTVKGPANRGAVGLPSVMADARGLRTLLVNLIQNAITHGGGDVTLRVRTPRAALRAVGGAKPAGAKPSGGWVEICVEDRGPGVASEDLPRLMRPFEQGESALTRATEGAGLGLPIVRLLVEAMGGTLKLRSELGAGFTATVTLPAA